MKLRTIAFFISLPIPAASTAPQPTPNTTLRYIDRIDYADLFLIDMKVSRAFNQIETYISATNVLDRDYVEVGSIPMPGRWIKGGLNLKLDF